MAKFILLFFFILVAGGVIALMPGIGFFEENEPKITLANAQNGTIYWNPKEALSLGLSDDSGLGNIEVFLVNGTDEQKLVSTGLDGQKELSLKLEFPKNIKYKNGEEYNIRIVVNDTSKAKFLSGNKANLQAKILVDTKNPDVFVIDQSYKIIQGGTGVAVFRASDTSELKELYVSTSFGKNFQVLPFYKEGYYAVLLAWPTTQPNFSASVVAVDKAGNTTKTPIRFYLQNKKYKESKIALNNAFLDGKIAELANMYAQNPSEMDAIAKFKFVNEELRGKNEEKIKEITSNIRENELGEFYIKPFYPLKNGAAVASFGDHRLFSFEGALLSESYHMGLDFASTAKANIVASNAGDVVFADENGIYGKNLIIYHGFGLYTLYGHCTTIAYEVGDTAQEGANIATTGITGLALGDHLHFGIIVQGIEVRPEEWMDKKWMKENIYDILENSKKAINEIKR